MDDPGGEGVDEDQDQWDREEQDEIDKRRQCDQESPPRLGLDRRLLQLGSDRGAVSGSVRGGHQAITRLAASGLHTR